MNMYIIRFAGGDQLVRFDDTAERARAAARNTRRAFNLSAEIVDFIFVFPASGTYH